MKVLNNLMVITIAIFFMNSCIRNSSFNKEELKFVKPYLKENTVIFQSPQGYMDTIVFSNSVIDTVELRNLSQGYYNENILRVTYKITSKSFHKLFEQSLSNELIDFISFSKAKNSHSSKEIYFLGLLFNEDYLDGIINENTGEIIVFKSDKAKYTGLNINKGIKSFKFSFTKGIESFIDDSGEWIRIN
jgi:hypothetical protein